MNDSYHDHFRGIGIAGMLFFLNQFTGISSLVVYMTSIFKVPFTAVYYCNEQTLHVLEFRFHVKQLILGIISGIWFDPEPSVGPSYNRWRTLLVPVNHSHLTTRSCESDDSLLFFGCPQNRQPPLHLLQVTSFKTVSWP